jgi:2-dehydro-3-deoxygluconokinase
MLRLKSPAFERLFQSPTLEATFGGAEANVAASLAQFGVRADGSHSANNVGDACPPCARSASRLGGAAQRRAPRVYFLGMARTNGRRA